MIVAITIMLIAIIIAEIIAYIIMEQNDFHLENVMYSYQYDIGYKRWKND